MQEDRRVKPHDYASTATDAERAERAGHAEVGSLGQHDYFNQSPPAAEHYTRDYSFESQRNPGGQPEEAHAMANLGSADSRTHLYESDNGGPALPPGATASPSYNEPSMNAGPGRHVHVQYPPLKQTPPPPAPMGSRDFTTVPLNDSRLPTPSGSARSRSKLGFIPLGGGQAEYNNESTSTLDHRSSPPNEKGHHTKPQRPAHPRTSSWDALGGEWEAYNPATAKDKNLRFAEGDAGTNKFSRMYLWAINRGIVVRWIIFIIPVAALLWIPGILDVCGVDGAKIWGVRMLWWSIWLTIVWCGFWAAKAAFLIVPGVFRQTICTIVPNMIQYVDVVRNLGKYATFIVWAAINFIAWQPIIRSRVQEGTSDASISNLATCSNLLLGLMICMIVLGVEKLLVQLIALQFHRDSYADRLAEQKFQLKCLTALYISSHDIPGRSDTLTDAQSSHTKGSETPKMIARKALRGLKSVAQSTTTALGNVASEMTGSSVLQTNSPHNKVKAAIASARKSKALARRLFYSFRVPGADHLTISDIARFFPDLDTAQAAFAIFDRDGNGDATRDEIDAALMDMHRERMSLEASMRDLDGAVRRLDEILLFIVGAIDILIISAMITNKITTFVTSTGTFILSLSWMIGTTMQEILLSCIFLFVKHPYDVGDRVDIDGNAYTVAKMELMSTSFKRVDGKFVWIGHNVLALKVIENIRRSGATAETFVFEVAFDTTFEKLQALRTMMLKFCKDNSRDFLPSFDVIVDDIPAQGKMILKADIKYKSNWQLGALKVQRRNKWVCQLKTTLSELKIWGPGDAGNPAPPPADPTRYTEVPWAEVKEMEANATRPSSPPPTFQAATTGGSLINRRNESALDIWGEREEAGGYDSMGPSRAPSPGPNAAFSIGGTPSRRPGGSLPPLAVAAQRAQAYREAEAAAAVPPGQGYATGSRF